MGQNLTVLGINKGLILNLSFVDVYRSNVVTYIRKMANWGAAQQRFRQSHNGEDTEFNNSL